MRTFLFTCLVAPLLLGADSEWQSEGVVSVTHSPHAKLHAVPIHAVKMGDGFWSARRAVNVEKSIPTLLAELEQQGRQRFGTIAGGNSFQIKPRNQFLDAFGLSQIGKKN